MYAGYFDEFNDKINYFFVTKPFVVSQPIIITYELTKSENDTKL